MFKLVFISTIAGFFAVQVQGQGTIENKIVIYEHRNFQGASRELTEYERNLGNIGFNDRISSIKVYGSVWVGYEHSQFRGKQYILEEGVYSSSGDWKGSNDQLSSLKKLNTDSLSETPTITLYEHGGYGGQAYTFEYPINNLGYYNFNDKVSSLKVKSGIWILYEHGGFNGKQHIVTEGYYRSGVGQNDKISSLRPVKEPNFPTEIIRMEFDINRGILNSKPVALVNLHQINNSTVAQQASWKTTRTLTTVNTYEWHWENSLAISVETTFKTGVPFIAEGEITMGIENTFSIGRRPLSILKPGYASR